MLDPALPPSIAGLLRDLERRISNLEVGGRLDNASIRPGGYIRGYTTDDLRVLEVGRLVGGGYGFAVNTADLTDTVFWVSDQGWSLPILYYHWMPEAPVLVTVTSSSFVATHQVHISGPVATILMGEFFLQSEVGTVGEVYCQITDPAGAVMATTSTRATTANSGQTGNIQWLHGIPLGNAHYIMRLFARRVSGANNVYVGTPVRLIASNAISVTPGGLRIDG